MFSLKITTYLPAMGIVHVAEAWHSLVGSELLTHLQPPFAPDTQIAGVNTWFT